MRNNKGITITSLIIYIVLIFVITTVLIRLTTNLGNNMVDVVNVSFETEFNKLNLYLLDESKKSGNEIIEIVDGKQILFSNGNNYMFNEKEKIIYFNNSVELCKNVETCLFEKKWHQMVKR